MAFCLMPNHFHFIVRIKETTELKNLWSGRINDFYVRNRHKSNFDPRVEILLDKFLVAELGHFFNGYVQSYNKKYSRMGSLLKESFQRRLINSREYLLRAICYVHNNPVASGFVNQREKWKYSSYNDILNDSTVNVQRKEVLELMGGKENYIYLHDHPEAV